jgi:hypothetical protein
MEVKTCLLKLLWIQEDERRKEQKVGITAADVDLPRLWILAATTSQSLMILVERPGLIGFRAISKGFIFYRQVSIRRLFRLASYQRRWILCG